MTLPLIDVPAPAEGRFTLQGYGRTYELTEEEFNAAMLAADALSPDARPIGTGEAARILGVSAKTVARLLDAGRIPCHRNGGTGHRMMEMRDVLAYKTRRDRRRGLLEQARDLAYDMGAYDDPAAAGPRG